MKLYIQQKVFTWADQFSVRGEGGEPRYFVQGELFSWGKKLHVLDGAERERAYIEQKVFAFLPRYHIILDGQHVADVVREFSFLHPRYTFEGVDWEVTGSFWEHDYQITRAGCPVASIHKQWMTWGDCYEVEIAEPQDELLVLAAVLVIDCVTAASAAAASAT